MALTLDEVAAIHGRCYDGEGLTDAEAEAVSAWIMGLDPATDGVGSVILAVYMTKYVANGKPKEGYALR